MNGGASRAKAGADEGGEGEGEDAEGLGDRGEGAGERDSRIQKKMTCHSCTLQAETPALQWKEGGCGS